MYLSCYGAQRCMLEACHTFVVVRLSASADGVCRNLPIMAMVPVVRARFQTVRRLVDTSM